jgi:hypothetical protein
MPVLSSFISYRPKRRTKPAKSPSAVRQFDYVASPHPYASPSSHVLNINDGRVLAPNRRVVEGDNYNGASNASNASTSPQVQLQLDLNPEPLADWFPTNLLESSPFALSLDGQRTPSSSRGTPYQNRNGRDTVGESSRANGGLETQESSSVEEDDQEGEEETDVSSVGDVLADLEGMDVCHYPLFYFNAL